MRHLKTLLIVGLLLALSGPAWAVPIPFSQPYTGATYWHFSNWDEGTLYTGLLADGITPVTAGSTYAPAALQSIAGTKAGAGEDSWGIIRVESIYAATVDMSQTDAITIGSIALYEYGSAGQTVEIVGMDRGRVDDWVTFVDMTPLNLLDPLTQVIQAHGASIDLYTQTKGTTELLGAGWGGGMQGPGARLVAGGSKYPGIGFDALGNPIVGSDLVLTGNAQAGFQLAENLSYFTPVPAGNTGSGTFYMYVSWTGGSQLASWNTDGFPIGYLLDPGRTITADMRIQGTVTPTGLPVDDPWLVHTSDPATNFFVPEPLTMVGMLLGIGSLGRYVRKRR